MSFADQLFRVVYDFTSDSDVELGVREGDIVVAEAPPQESWLLVHLKNDPSKKGYIPSGTSLYVSFIPVLKIVFTKKRKN
jgi:hypothetical protein